MTGERARLVGGAGWLPVCGHLTNDELEDAGGVCVECELELEAAIAAPAADVSPAGNVAAATRARAASAIRASVERGDWRTP